MNYTNKHDLPRGLFEALTFDDYDMRNSPPNVMSVTSIVGPPKVARLRERHSENAEMDASEMTWTLLGNNVHYIVQHRVKGEYLAEERWYVNLKTWEINTIPKGGTITECSWYSKDEWYLSGKTDLYDGVEKAVDDYKVTSVWSLIMDKKKPDWEAQLNIYAFALRLLGFETLKLRNVLILRDWQKSKAMHDSEYPQINLGIKHQKVWSDEDCMAYILDRARLHYKSMKQEDDQIPHCSPEERWTKETVYAFKKKGSKRSTRNYTDKKQAYERLHRDNAKAPGEPYEIEIREGEETRCLYYCSYNKFCNFGKQVLLQIT